MIDQRRIEVIARHWSSFKTSLDFTISKKFGDGFKLTMRAENLLNNKVRRISDGNVDYAKSSGTKYSLSLSGNW